ncbi:NAD(P)-dependent oxidoreductase [Shimia sp. R11_0]|uniref:NAD-dependent epimerase/dehydratase family protein n=1 Tax=Shimia sp. R11_0 TaxID=2821096 RepID=UPI001ADB8EBD|nr:NAD(P)-dependent oxidoreductase [Shimia sp. R11_0]
MTTAPIVITGANGFVGRACVAEARRQGVPVRALIRDPLKAPNNWADDPEIEIVIRDLAEADETLSEVLEGAGAVIHCAATLAGDHARDTLAASTYLIEALVGAKVPHLILAGSLSVYDVAGVPDGGTLREDSPVGTKGRDLYAQAKAAQEQQFFDGAALYGFALSVLRLGAVWGAGQLFNAHIGPALGPLVLRIDGGGSVPLCRRDLAAETLVRAATRSETDFGTGLGVINVLDDDLPDRRRFVAALKACGWPRYQMPVPLRLMRLIAAATPNNNALPGLLHPAILEARHRPLHYDNAMMHKRLGPVTMMPFERAMQGAIDHPQDDQPQKEQANPL